jgi:hypothetical protein
MLRPLHAILDDLVDAEVTLQRIRVSRDAALRLLTDADGQLATAKARVTGLRTEIEAHVQDRVNRHQQERATHAA